MNHDRTRDRDYVRHARAQHLGVEIRVNPDATAVTAYVLCMMCTSLCPLGLSLFALYDIDVCSIKSPQRRRTVQRIIII